jgi:hypothetical protein
VARVDLGLTDDEYGRMHPARFAALRERLDVRERRADARAALIAIAASGAGGSVSIEDLVAELRMLPELPPALALAGPERPAPKPDEKPSAPAKRPTIINVPDDPFFAPLVHPEQPRKPN